MRRLESLPLIRNNRALSYTVSAVLITGTTIILVLIASLYAYQILEQQKGVAEFEVAKKSILSFNDGVENVAWTLQRARSARFTVEFGRLKLTPNAYPVKVNYTVGSSTSQLYSNSSGKVTYELSNKYTSLGEGYSSYLLGNENIIIGSTEPYGRALISQQTGLVTINLDYRVRVMRTSVIKVGSINVTYIDIWVIRLKIKQPWSYVHEFDLKANCTKLQTITSSSVPVNGDPYAVIGITLGSSTKTIEVPLDTSLGSRVVFSLVVSDVQVST